MKNFAWSYSTLGLFEQCPLRYKYKKIDKLPEPPAPALEKGLRLHKHCEDFLKGKTKTVNPEVKTIEPHLKALKKYKAQSELKMQFDRDMQPLADWFDKRVWLRVVLDAHYVNDNTVQTYDFKTGKVYEDKHAEQGQVINMASLSWYPNVERAEFKGIYIDQVDQDGYGKTIQYTTDTQQSLPDLIAKWTARADVIENATEYAANPTKLCGWCPYSGTKNGPCRHG